MTGKAYAQALDRAGLECNYNTVPFDPRKPFDPSGLRLGTPSVTSRGMKEAEMATIAGWFSRVAENVANEAELDKIAGEVQRVLRRVPVPGDCRSGRSEIEN